jgi:hypothetical protein
MFKVREGIYVVPNFGRVDTRKGLSNEQLLALYENRDFPFITITAKCVPFLKKQKLDVKRVASLILRAKTIEEVNLLLQVNNKKPLPALAATKNSALEI